MTLFCPIVVIEDATKKRTTGIHYLCCGFEQQGGGPAMEVGGNMAGNKTPYMERAELKERMKKLGLLLEKRRLGL